jgi:hypothetical protein
LEALAISPTSEWLRQVRSFAEVPPREWPFREGYQRRYAPRYLGVRYGKNQSLVEQTEEYVKDHGLEECTVAAQMVPDAEAIDSHVLGVQEANINKPVLEMLAQSHGVRWEAFDGCREKSDWLRPKHLKPEQWVTKVKWEVLERVDPRWKEVCQATFPDIQAEINQQREKNILAASIQSKLADRLKGQDPLNK